ncbi:antibiotic biosynthesis monooxygenase family protein [Adhaeribacter aquaticus]|uniref:antibiotic biosynthesis monooxygenase family protein n=1 Tax=Adhaeribacter aquaticus TaxID=299567 RepID=UPI0004044557|nr:antibiotic biosynthesis monooxygenase [Adhaeribacter aquaticus]
MFIALSTFTIANEMSPEVREAFVNRPHLVDSAPGFQRMEVFSPQDNPNEIWLMTYWADEDSYQVWHKSHVYHDSHQGIPKGLKLVPRSAKVRFFSKFAN